MKKNVIISIILFLLCQLSAYTQPVDPNIIKIAFPSAKWNLSLSLKNFKIEKSSPGYILATRNDGMTVSVFIEKADHAGDNIECRSFYWGKASQSPLPKENLKLYEKPNIAFVEYDVKSFQGKKINFHSMNAYLSHGGYWIDVHISKTQYQKSDKALFDGIVNSLKIEEAKDETAADIFAAASNAYYSQDYQNAIAGYEQILQNQKADFAKTTAWYITVDNLGMAYGITGDMKNAKRVLEYGTAGDPAYPNFYYNLACVYAETSDLDNMLKNLESALKNKANVLPGEKLPDPRADSSFKNYSGNKQFKQLLKKYGV